MMLLLSTSIIKMEGEYRVIADEILQNKIWRQITMAKEWILSNVIDNF